MEKPIGEIVLEWIPFLMFFSVIPLSYYMSARYGKIHPVLSAASYVAVFILFGLLLSGILIAIGIRPIGIAAGIACIIIFLAIVPLHRKLLKKYSEKCTEPKDFSWSNIFSGSFAGSIKGNSQLIAYAAGISAFILLLAGLFYWYEYRPSNIRKNCLAQSYVEAHDIYKLRRGKRLTKEEHDLGWFNRDDFNFVYRNCLSSNGLQSD